MLRRSLVTWPCPGDPACRETEASTLMAGHRGLYSRSVADDAFYEWLGRRGHRAGRVITARYARARARADREAGHTGASCVQMFQFGMELAGCLVGIWPCRAPRCLSVPSLLAAASRRWLIWAVALGWKGGASWTVVAGLPHSCCLIQTETWAGSRAWCTTPARSSRTESRSTVSFRRAANAATVDSAS